jgi:hypothetical protein
MEGITRGRTSQGLENRLPARNRWSGVVFHSESRRPEVDIGFFGCFICLSSQTLLIMGGKSLQAASSSPIPFTFAEAVLVRAGSCPLHQVGVTPRFGKNCTLSRSAATERAVKTGFATSSIQQAWLKTKDFGHARPGERRNRSKSPRFDGLSPRGLWPPPLVGP